MTDIESLDLCGTVTLGFEFMAGLIDFLASGNVDVEPWMACIPCVHRAAALRALRAALEECRGMKMDDDGRNMFLHSVHSRIVADVIAGKISRSCPK